MNYVLLVLLALTFAIIQGGIGGAKMLYSLPAYGCLALAAIATVFIPQRRLAPRAQTICVASLFLMVGYICVRAWYSPVEYLAKTDLLMVMGAVIAYFLSAYFLPKGQHRSMLMVVLLVLAALHVGIGAIQFKEARQFMLFSPWIIRTDYEWRASGFYICPNHLAGFLEMLGLVCMSLAIWARWRLTARFLIGYAAAMCFLGVALTGSRGGFLSTFAGLCVVAFFGLQVVRKTDRRRFWPAVWTVTGLGVAAVASAVVLMYTSTALKSRLDHVYDPGNIRLYLWEAAIKQWKLDPWVGTGAGTHLYYGREFRSTMVQRDPIHVHNDYLELLCEYGVIGVAVVLIFFGVHLWSGYRGFFGILRRKMDLTGRPASNELALVIGAVASLIAILVHSVIDFNLHLPANTVFVAFLCGILAAPTVDGEQALAKIPLFTRITRYFPPALALLVLGWAVPMVRGEYCAEWARQSLRDHYYPEAVQWAQKGIAVEKSNPDLYYYLGEAQHYLALMDTFPPAQRKAYNDGTVAAFQEGLRLFPRDLRLLLKLGRTLDRLGRYAESAPIYELALKVDPNFGNTHGYYGLHLHRQHRFRSASLAYRKALSLGGSDVAVAGLRDLEKDRKTAREFARFDVNDPELDAPLAAEGETTEDM